MTPEVKVWFELVKRECAVTHLRQEFREMEHNYEKCLEVSLN